MSDINPEDLLREAEAWKESRRLANLEFEDLPYWQTVMALKAAQQRIRVLEEVVAAVEVYLAFYGGHGEGPDIRLNEALSKAREGKEPTCTT